MLGDVGFAAFGSAYRGALMRRRLPESEHVGATADSPHVPPGRRSHAFYHHTLPRAVIGCQLPITICPAIFTIREGHARLLLSILVIRAEI